jgi:hypothetical protein
MPALPLLLVPALTIIALSSGAVNHSVASAPQAHTSSLHNGNAVYNGPGLRIGIEECKRFGHFTHIFQDSDVVEQQI